MMSSLGSASGVITIRTTLVFKHSQAKQSSPRSSIHSSFKLGLLLLSSDGRVQLSQLLID